jgi:uncharacterized protein (DUF2126 family)
MGGPLERRSFASGIARRFCHRRLLARAGGRARIEAMAGPDDRALDEAVLVHDRAVAAAGLAIWVGGEPTFTDPTSLAAPWTHAALGGDKEARARELVRRLALATPGALVLRTLGRQYPGEPRARFSYGVYARRDGVPAWPQGATGDPIVVPGAAPPALAIEAILRDRLADRLVAAGHAVRALHAFGVLPARLAFCADRAALERAGDGELERPSVHDGPLPAAGPRDTLAEAGILLVCIGLVELDDGVEAVRVELPAVPDVAAFLALAAAIAGAGADCGAGALVLTGFPPPVDATVALSTVTPDPAVIEVSAAPCRDLAEYLAGQRVVHACAAEVGLAPLRYAYDGDVLDSGGGGHVTLGGPSPSESPFVRAPRLLPGLVRYANRHPSLSYLFAAGSLGASSQAPRADEGLPEAFVEIGVALERLARAPAENAASLWAALAPLLADHTGNPHRAEINVEKLGDPGGGPRGRLGLVELRALGMAEGPARAAAVAALFRTVAARLARRAYEEPLVAWGEALHDRFALPFFLGVDLEDVLADLAASGLGLAPVLARELRRAADRRLGQAELAAGVRLVVSRALEFWPLVGDAASQERRTVRCVDASTSRIELVVRALDPAALGSVVACVDGVRVPFVRARDREGEALVAGVRFRAFVPSPGLHPSLPAHGPVVLVAGAAGAPPRRVTLHPWSPGGGAYDGLPRDRAEAARRRAERFVVADAPEGALEAARDAPSVARTASGLDLRFLA